MRYYFYILSIILIALSGVKTQAQDRYDANMVMGYWSDDRYKDPVLQFRQDSVHLDYQRLALENESASCNISDKEGNLLFYFNGCSVANAQHEIMENGTGFNPSYISQYDCISDSDAYISSLQSCLILPTDDKDSLFTLLHLTNVYYKNDSIIFYGIPRYSVVDMKANEGRGRVVLKNQIYHPDTTMNLGAMTAVRHANNKDWWIINQDEDWSTTIYTTLLKEGALIPTGSQNIGPKWKRYNVAEFSPDGSRYFRYSNYYSGLSVMDFDRETGRFSRERHLPVTQENIFAYGGNFSPSGQYVYIGNGPYLMQIDADKDTLVADTIAVWDGTAAYWGQPAYFGAMQTGPDCRIYMATGYCVPFMHVIMEPDKPGKACDVRQHFFTLETPICSVPHFPNYRLGTPYPYCDPDVKVVSATQQFSPVPDTPPDYLIFPNPAWDRVSVSGSHIIRHIVIRDMTGRVVLRSDQWPDTVWQLDVSALTEGLYTATIHYGSTDNRVTKKIVVMR